MSLEMVKEIKEAEAKADVLKKDSAAQARQIAVDCQKACSALMEAARTKARETMNDALRLADKAAEEEGEARRAQINLQCETIVKSASTRIDSAADIIVERIVGG